MINFVPIESYYPIYINICLFLVLFTILHTRVVPMESPKNLSFINISGLLLLAFLVLYIGLRPIHPIFGDTVNYVVTYSNYQIGLPIKNAEDYGWHVFMKALAPYMSIHAFFTIISFIYIFPLYKISTTYFKEYWYYAFLMFVVSFSFWTYSVNGIRNGAACSLFLWGLCYEKRKILMVMFFGFALLFHKTLFLPILAYLATYFYNNPKFYFKGWLMCIPLSLVLGGVWISLFSSLGFADDRLSGYLSSSSEEGTFSATGFRWDFLFHSAFAVFVGWYFVVKKGFSDALYNRLLNTYLICNGFWVLVIRANFSNRFAYLSWFMMAIVIIYPLLKKNFFKNQHALLGNIILAYFSFTYLMFYLYYS